MAHIVHSFSYQMTAESESVGYAHIKPHGSHQVICISFSIQPPVTEDAIKTAYDLGDTVYVRDIEGSQA